MIFLEVDGFTYEGFTDISVVCSIGAISGSYTFGVTSSKKVSLPIQEGQSCRVLIDDTPIINGYVETMPIAYDSETHTIQISGRDRTMDAIDSSTVLKELSGTLSLQAAMRQILDANGLQDIEVINQVSGLAPFKDGDIESAEVGETVFEYVEKYARKRQVLLTRDGSGNIVITRSGTANSVTALLNVVGGTNNNILSGSGQYSGTELFNKYTVRSQQNPAALDNAGTVSASAISNQSGTVFDNNVRATRILEIRPDQSGSSDDSKQFATWSRNIRRAKAFSYTAVVEGHYQNEAKTRLWVPNEIVSINDDFIGMSSQLNAKMLIDTVEYKQNLKDGTTTIITCVDKNAYTLQSEQDLRDSRANDLGA